MTIVPLSVPSRPHSLDVVNFAELGVVVMRSFFLAPFALFLLPQPVYAGMTKSQYTAPNGVVITVNSDDFAGRREYSSPDVNLTADDGHGTAMVGEVFNNGKLLGLTIQGLVFYSGDWRFYSSAIFKGGEPASYHRMDGNVNGCSQYGCSMAESFLIDITRDEARSHAEGGVVAVQVRSDHGQTALVQLPLAYFDAVADVAGEPTESTPADSANAAAAAPSAPVPDKPGPGKTEPARPSKPASRKEGVTWEPLPHG
jgi:hypothetical protein